MRSILAWLKIRLETFALLPEYGKATAKQWMNILFGETVVGAIFLIWWALTNPRNPPLVLIFVVAVIVAGYYVWRADHVRLIPKLAIVQSLTQETPTNAPAERRVFVQVEPQCLTDAPVKDCRGHLLRVWRRFAVGENWQLTEMKERLPLEWSHLGAGPITLYPSGGQYLNICFRPSNVWVIVPAVQPLPLRWKEVFDITATFKFDIEITAENCPPARASVLVCIDGAEFSKPIHELIREFEEDAAMRRIRSVANAHHLN